ncbi:MFS general substrate transporter [Guyanagaster necrorhizus]|uniref:MFS general substrate transporter n=1 Tax=Guyanagaster necrorhizus TaxID=856835 RepID=A0A9P8AV93_9AGAR|nr:MFS general substrate transporter [Guyanagaster necrorhizus MCA 3950]KAG7449314.1 MFS general substrate transporter [Guyanagaster necrorhizus MCA 3950]
MDPVHEQDLNDPEKRLDEYTHTHEGQEDSLDQDAKYGGHQARISLEKKLLWKIDLRMSILIFIYILNYIDRNNAAAARLRGLEDDLHLKGEEFATLLSILYVGYIIMQIPSNMFLNWIGKPSVYLPACMIVWGVISCLTGGFVGALLTRFFLGFVEAAFFPGALFLISKWYKREEIGVRTAILYCGNIISNAFGNLLASGILSGMEGKLGHAAWRWLFYIEGSLTVFIAILAIFILPDFPATTKWLSPLERQLAIQRMEEDVGVGDQNETEDGSPMNGLWLALKDWKIWWMSLALTAQVVGLSFNQYFPTLRLVNATMGFNRTVTLLLCAPPFVFTTILSFIISRHSDKTKERFYHIIVPFVFGIVGFILAVSTMNTAARYVSLFLMAQSYAGFVVMYAWISNCFPRPPSKRAVALALTNAFSQLGNVAGSYVWPTMWGPTYNNSDYICIAVFAFTIIMNWIFRQHLIALNKKMEKGVGAAGFRYLI